ncbi:MAG TPA: apolipoprotein N-acyltransferase, partial [Phaeodactylibacter sp.]|nr:apolipoprotein N-acyltransferase [Phaeodactylibacter sp.]
FEPHYVKFNLTRQQTLEQFIKLSKAALSKESDYLVFPETSFHGIRYHRLHSDTQLRALHKLVDEYPHLSLVTGIGSSKVYAKGEQPSPTARTHIRGGDTLYWESQNAAIQIHSNSKDIDFYLKSKLVPGAEIFPYHRFLFFIKPIVDQLGGAPGGLERQATRSVFSSPSGKVAPVICYESIYGEYCTGYIRNGAEAIFIVTNDGWWDNTAGHRQHLAFARLRAIETRRAIARAANSGISAFINQRGDVISATRYDEAASLKENILFNNEITFYTLWGDMIGRIAGFLSILLLLNALVKGLMKKT